MIIIAGEMQVAAENAAAARDGAIAMAAETVKEAGCIRYRFWADLQTQGLFHVYEEWETADALGAHMETPHMATWRALIGGLGLISRDVRKFETEGPQPLG